MLNIKNDNDGASSQPKVVVVGVGNVLLKDEGIGVHVARALQERNLPPGVEVIDGGTLPDIFLTMEGVDKLIVVDAVKAEGEPGAIYRFRPEDVKLESIFTSVHEVGLLANLWLMERSGQKPGEVVVICIVPGDLGVGLELSPALAKRLPDVVEIVLEEIQTGPVCCQAVKGEWR